MNINVDSIHIKTKVIVDNVIIIEIDWKFWNAIVKDYNVRDKIIDGTLILECNCCFTGYSFYLAWYIFDAFLIQLVSCVWYQPKRKVSRRISGSSIWQWGLCQN